MSLVADRVLSLAVERVKRNTRIALDTRPKHIDTDGALSLIGPVNDEAMFVALTSAQLVLDAEPVTA